MTKKVLIVGDWRFSMYEQSFADALITVDRNLIVDAFKTRAYFSNYCGLIEEKFGWIGPFSFIMNLRLLLKIVNSKYDAILFWRPTQISKINIKLVKYFDKNVKLICYNHDDFSGPDNGAPVPWSHFYLWRNFLKMAPLMDVHFVKRQSNITHLHELGVKSVFIMHMWFDPNLHRPLETSEIDLHSKSDVVFIGHYEDDGRVEFLEAIARAGFNLRIWGDQYWTKEVLGAFLFDYLPPIKPVYGNEYTKVLNGAKICLAFFSKLNRDTYTRRCFEIPACGKLLLCERTKDMQLFFKEGEEAVFFSTVSELIEKINWLLKNPDLIKQISKAGYERVWKDNHTVSARATQLYNSIYFDHKS